MKYSQSLAAINLLLLLQLISSISSSSDVVISDHCPEKCGNVTVPYPFGIGDDTKCAISDFFHLKCDNSSGGPQLVFGENIPVVDISVDNGTFSSVMPAIYSCYDEAGLSEYWSNGKISLDGPFHFSNVHNKLTAFGCDTLAFMTYSGGTYASGCVSLCDGTSAAAFINAYATNNSTICSGMGCCQSSIPLRMKSLNISLFSLKNHSHISKWNPCDYAFLEDESFPIVGGSVNQLLSQFPDSENPETSIAAIEWVVEEKKCEEARWNRTSYGCRENSTCVYSENGNGYRCKCKPGYEGNPYLGCKDINECAKPEDYKCHGKCKNTPGNYTCTCPVGMRGDGTGGCEGFRVTTFAAATGGAVLLSMVLLLMAIIYKRRKKEKNFLLNGGMLLQHQRVKIFKESELSKATNNYNAAHFLGEGGFGHVYKGILSDPLSTIVAIKKPKGSLDKAHTISQEFQHEIAVVSQVNHINVVKVLGLCLETKLPLLVYEFIPNGTLSDHIHKQRSRVMSTWKHRLRIATEVANALDYLHSLANPPIIHGDIKSANILLDSEFQAKISDFGASVLISAHQQTTMLNKIQGTLGYLDPEYMLTGDLNPKSDVYSFGAVMVELLTGEKPYSLSSVQTGEMVSLIQYFLSSDFDNIIGIWGGFEDGVMEEMEAFAEVARQCLNFSGMKRPTMKEVAEELSRLRKLNNSASSMSSAYSQETVAGKTEEYSVATFDMESFVICR